MAVERTLVILKPDAVKRGCVGKIMDRYLAAELHLVGYPKTFIMKEYKAEALYAEHKGKPFFEGLVLAMISGACMLIVLEGEKAIERVRLLNGHTDPKLAKPGTIRHDFMSAGGPFNMVHASANSEEAERELALFANGTNGSS